MGNLLVYTILLSLQIVGFDAADAYTIDVLEQSSLTRTLTVERTGPILFLRDGDAAVLEVEQSQLYAHMFTVYTAADEVPRAFNLLEPLLQLPAVEFDRTEISVPAELLALANNETQGPTTYAERTVPSAAVSPAPETPSVSIEIQPMEPPDEMSNTGSPSSQDHDGIQTWTIQRRGTTHYLSLPAAGITVVIRLY